MKRRRRIEVIRYTQRSMVIEGCNCVTELEPIADPVMEIKQEVTADQQPAVQGPGKQLTRVSVAAMPSRRVFTLRDLLRLWW